MLSVPIPSRSHTTANRGTGFAGLLLTFLGSDLEVALVHTADTGTLANRCARALRAAVAYHNVSVRVAQRGCEVYLERVVG